ncbi:SAM-dependent methyltransferase [Aspergillus oryzae 100-8]|uniref:SAM-dependent methyltransferase n=1 Tax=Aspergillus oryzae (strain 3.042) TaxID=1160506 RepID=I8TPM7_ASPO3|nr:SAM-dependent methyltransferase [Aspergillus oryzae 3.042]KDE85895.1 SAM-dependent methyltransferase [Aspergillus oryzae 100-8]|eukprot:EIT76185.1 SAM-dependent methyltransferase [Aspergillus oryzae 3.042]
MAVYITDHSTPVPKTHSWRIASNSATYLLPHLTPTSKILDIGCGPSSISIDFARRANQGYIIGIEHVPDPLNQARHLAASQDMTNIDFQLGDIHALEFLDNIFNIVHVHRVLQYITNPVKALDEIRRGIVVAKESAKDGNPHPRRFKRARIRKRESVRSSGLAKTAVQEGYATKEELEKISKGWNKFVEEEQAWFGLLHGEILCWK